MLRAPFTALRYQLLQKPLLPSLASLSYQPPFNNEPADYKQVVIDRKKKLDSLLSSKNRFQRISEREDRSDVPPEYSKCLSKGKYLSLYRGFDVCKAPEDFVLYHQLFSYVKPATVIELGTFVGGMAIWITDTLKLLDIPCQVYSMDLDLSQLNEKVKRLKPDNLTFLNGDSFAIDQTFSAKFLSTLPHPWVVVEDAHANMGGVLRHFHQYMKEGDYFSVEDTNPFTAAQVGMGGVTDDQYTLMGPKQLTELKGFLKEFEEYYSIDSFITDLFGYNCSWHWHGFIRRMK